MFPERKEISEKRKKYLARFLPLVRFVFEKRTEERYEWHRFFPVLLADFVLWCDSRNAGTAEMIRIRGVQWNDSEGGIGMFWIGDEYIAHCKMYCYDGTPESGYALSEGLPWHGVQFRDHADSGSRFSNTVKVFSIADAFEKFLAEKQIAFTRDNMKGR